MTARQVRAVRGFTAASIATTLAATAHTIGGGTPPAWWLVLAVTLLATPVSVALIGRRPSAVRTALAASAAQALLHTAYAAVGDAAPTVAAHVHSIVGSTTGGAVAPIAATAHLHVDAGMLLAHLVAAAATIALLVRGEALLRALARGVRRLLPRVSLRPLPTVSLPMRAYAPRLPGTDPLFSAISRRGPPLPAV